MGTFNIQHLTPNSGTAAAWLGVECWTLNVECSLHNQPDQRSAFPR